MSDAARELDLDFHLPSLAIVFGNPGEEPRPGAPLIDRPGDNMYNVPRSTCRLCGECYLGCNFGSKQTLDHTYLSQAKNLGAEIRARSEVRSFLPRDGGGYQVTYVYHDPASDGTPCRPRHMTEHVVTCDRLILAAGALGSSYLLLKMRDIAPDVFGALSPQLGMRFSDNGDLLTFVVRSHEADPTHARRLAPWLGPTITSAIRVPDAADGGQGRGFYVEDAGFPAFLAWVIEAGIPRPGTIRRVLVLARRYLARLVGMTSKTNFGDVISDAIGDARLTGTSMPLLTMGRNVPAGTLFLNRGKRLDIDWRFDDTAEYLAGARNLSERLAAALDGKFYDNPFTYLRRLTTVHPLGGCSMGRSRDEGVVNPMGEVFGFPGLYVADGSVMPGPVGPNPAFTIAALANRFADEILAQLRR